MINLKEVFKKSKGSGVVFGIIGFFMGRAIFFESFNPFVLAYVTAFFCKRDFYAVAAMSALGLLTVTNEINIFRYMFAILMLCLFNYCADKDSMTKIKKAGISALSTFSGGIIFTLFSNMAPYYAIMSFLESGLTVILYMIIGDNISIFNFFDTNVIQSEGYSNQVKNVISSKLKKASDIFMNISRTYSSSLLIEEVEENKTRINIVDNIGENICKNCEMHSYCWEKNRDKTYKKIYCLVDKWLEDGCVNTNTPFARECLHSGEVFMLSKGSVELYRLNKLWLNKIEQSKLLIGRQLGIMSNLLDDLHNDVSTGFNIDKELSNMIYKSMTGLKVNSVVAIKGKRGYEVSVNVPHYYNCSDCGTDIAEHISEILGVKMKKESSNCRIENNNCLIHFVEQPRLRIAPYMAGIKRDNSEISGDCYTYMDLEDGKYLLALADGMGSGSEARNESAASIEMYEDFMEAGFDRSMALDIINSILLAGNEKECFSTLDICTIDMYSGDAEFVKIGAVSTFILREDKIELIKSQTLPVGILGEIDTDITSVTLDKGDIIIMMTDGILDSTGNVLRNEKWLLNLIMKNKDKTPKALAGIILKKAKENSHYTIRDDMTVLVAQIY